MPETDSLFDQPADGVDAANPFGRPGPRIARSGAFYRGFVAALGVLLALLIGYSVRATASVLVLIGMSIVLAIGLNPIVELLIRHGMRRRWAVLIVTVGVLGTLSLIVIVFVQAVRHQVTTFIDDAPHLIADLRKNKTLRELDDRYHFLTDLQAKLQDPHLLRRIFGSALDIGLGVLGAVVNTLVVVIMTVYFLAALPQVKRTAYRMAPASRRTRVSALGDEILRRVGGYVVGALLVALLAGTLTMIVLFSVGLGRYALPLALLVALLDLVPLVGSVTGAGVVTLIGLATSLHTGVIILIFYLIYEPIEGYVIYPRVMRSTVDIPEIVTIIAVLLGGSLGGIVGALLALPLAAAALLVVREVFVRGQDSA